VRFYSDHLQAGNYHLSYTAAVVAPGKFLARPARAYESYHADVMGQSKAEYITVNHD
jgi:uncharacterized protein YfaS (alpha-2-macroglobulin family)